MDESTLQSKVLNFLHRYGIYAVKIHSSNRSGTPDILANVNGKFVGIETKSNSGRLSELQQHHKHKIISSKGEFYIVRPDNLESFQQQIIKLKKSLNI